MYEPPERKPPRKAAAPRARPARKSSSGGRSAKEAASLAAFESGSLVRLTRLKDVHAWVTSRHAAYSIPGVLEKKPMDAALAASY